MELKEAKKKENLPVSFLTNFTATSWDQVGLLKQEIEAIHKEFNGTKKVEELIQNLIDAYLVCIGQIEQHMKDNDYLDLPEKKNPLISEDADTKKDLKEDVNININTVEIKNPEIKTENKDKTEIEAKSEPTENTTASCCPECKPDEKLITPEAFEYFCEFDAPDMTKKLTDEDIYGHIAPIIK